MVYLRTGINIWINRTSYLLRYLPHSQRSTPPHSLGSRGEQHQHPNYRGVLPEHDQCAHTELVPNLTPPNIIPPVTTTYHNRTCPLPRKTLNLLPGAHLGLAPPGSTRDMLPQRRHFGPSPTRLYPRHDYVMPSLWAWPHRPLPTTCLHNAATLGLTPPGSTHDMFITPCRDTQDRIH